MVALWIFLELANLVVFTIFIMPLKQPEKARLLLPLAATKLLRISWSIPILIFAYSLFLTNFVDLAEWGFLLIATVGNVLMIKGRIDLGKYHTWAGYYLPGVSLIKTGIFKWISHPMYTGIILVIISCSMVYITRLPNYLSIMALFCCLYIILFLVIAAYRERTVGSISEA